MKAVLLMTVGVIGQLACHQCHSNLCDLWSGRRLLERQRSLQMGVFCSLFEIDDLMFKVAEGIKVERVHLETFLVWQTPLSS